MAAPAPLAYVPLDNFDRNMFDHVLSDNVERVAFINYFDHVNSNVKRHKRKYQYYPIQSSPKLISYRTEDWSRAREALEQSLPVLDCSCS